MSLRSVTLQMYFLNLFGIRQVLFIFALQILIDKNFHFEKRVNDTKLSIRKSQSVGK